VDSADFGPLPEACARLPYRIEWRRPCCQGVRQRSAGWGSAPPSAAIARAVAGSKVCVAANPGSIRLPGSVVPFRRLPSREAPRSVIHTAALFEECNRRRRLGWEIGRGAVGMLFVRGECCGTLWKSRVGPGTRGFWRPVRKRLGTNAGTRDWPIRAARFLSFQAGKLRFRQMGSLYGAALEVLAIGPHVSTCISSTARGLPGIHSKAEVVVVEERREAVLTGIKLLCWRQLPSLHSGVEYLECDAICGRPPEAAPFRC